MKIGILLIATGKYTQFVQSLIKDIEKYFLTDNEITVHLFTDDMQKLYVAGKVLIRKHAIPSYRFPYATLYRYKIFDENKYKLKEHDYLFYTDVDMAIVGKVGDEVLVDGLLCVHHPGYYTTNGWGSGGCSPESLAFLPPEKRNNYFAGGVQGGKSDDYLQACNILNARILDDEGRGVMAEWHDETHWNWILNSNQTGLKYTALTPSYCMVEQMNLRELWGINNLEPRIIALAKNHQELRK